MGVERDFEGEFDVGSRDVDDVFDDFVVVMVDRGGETRRVDVDAGVEMRVSVCFGGGGCSWGGLRRGGGGVGSGGWNALLPCAGNTGFFRPIALVGRYGLGLRLFRALRSIRLRRCPRRATHRNPILNHIDII